MVDRWLRRVRDGLIVVVLLGVVAEVISGVAAEGELLAEEQREDGNEDDPPVAQWVLSREQQGGLPHSFPLNPNLTGSGWF